MQILPRVALTGLVLLAMLASGTRLAAAAPEANPPPELRAAVPHPGDIPGTVLLARDVIGKKFLLQVSYEQHGGQWQDFMTSRSRIITFQRHGAAVRMIEDSPDPKRVPQSFLTIPVLGETRDALLLDLNEGFDRISKEEDRTGEDYYGRVRQRDVDFIRLHMQEIVRVLQLDSMLVLEQHALVDDQPVSVYYYLSPYRPNGAFQPFELRDLTHFGFYETYPQRSSGRTVLYATKFDTAKPIIFALSDSIPRELRGAVREGVLYWNGVLGRELIQVIDAPPGVSAPSARYNVLQWVTDLNFASTSHIQADPLTGEILHAHIFLDAQDLQQEADRETQLDRLRYVAAHEVGHALGLRHNFAKGPASTVMNYYDFSKGAALGRRLRSSDEGLEYDRKVMRHVYLGAPLDLGSLPAFCTDGQPVCGRPATVHAPQRRGAQATRITTSP